MKHIVLMLLLLPLIGCSPGIPPKVDVHPVSGKINYAGKPASGIKVFLYPTSAPTPPQIPMNPHAETAADGSFHLSTYASDDGAAVGGYQILLLWPEVVEESEESTIDRLMNWYDGAHSKLTFDVKAGDNKIPVIEIPLLKGPPPEIQGIPGRN